MPNKTPQEIMKLPYERVLIPEETGGFSAYVAEFEGCGAGGATAEEAMRNLEQAAIEWVAAEQESARDIPQPWNLQEFSGRILVRLPRGLHQQLARQADREGASLNSYVVQKLSAEAREDTMVSVLSDLLEKMRPVYIGQQFINLGTTESLTLPESAGMQILATAA